jgi:hypothetical protein
MESEIAFVFGESATDRGLGDVEDDAREHRHVDDVALLIQKMPLYRGFCPANPSDRALIAAFQYRERRLQGELDVIAPAVVQVDRRRIDRPLVRSMLEDDGDIVFPMTITRRAGVVCDHWWPALSTEVAAR